MKDCFSTYHPIINFTYFAAIFAFSMFERHPVFLGISCVCALIYSVYLKGRKAALFALCAALPIFIVSTVLNPIFNHEGYTLLFYMKNGNPVTLESILFGMVSGAMLVAILMWFSCFNEVISSDKFIYLFGQIGRASCRERV